MPEQAGASWARLWQVGASWGRLGQAGAGWGRLGQVGAGWAKFKLAQCSHCFFLCVLFTIYVRGTNCVNHSGVRNEQKG